MDKPLFCQKDTSRALEKVSLIGSDIKKRFNVIDIRLKFIFFFLIGVIL